MSRTLTLYRDDSTVQVVYDRVKSVFWTAGNTVLVVSQFTDEIAGTHRYIHWPRERFCWFKDEPGAAGRVFSQEPSKASPPKVSHPEDCECGGEGWLWGHELRHPPEVVTDTRYACDRQRESGEP